MTTFFLNLYEFFCHRRWMCYGCLGILVVALSALTLRMDYKEDIYDFLPLGDEYQQELAVYQSISQSDKIFVIFNLADSTGTEEDNKGLLADAIDRFAALAEERNLLHLFKDLTTQIDYDQITEVTDGIYEKIPYFLTLQDYQHIDSLLTPEYVKEQVRTDKQLLMFPSAGILSNNIGKDPLNIFSTAVKKLQTNNSIPYDIEDGYIFSADHRSAYAMFSTPFGASETSGNTRLVQQLDRLLDELQQQIPEVSVHAAGAPIIAVGNATQIKRDSLLAVSLAVVLILLLLVYAFRNARNLLLIGLSILFGWLFAMAALSLISGSVSLIVLGIASVIVGIAVNYPLHLVAHLHHEPDVRSTLKVIVSPLLIGNITTVGAFMALIPLEAPAMRDLGIFSSCMLIGTILFVLVFLPHFVSARSGQVQSERALLTRLAGISFENKRWTVYAAVLVTAVFGYFSLFTSFDADMRNINYMTDEQKKDLAQMENMMSTDSMTTVYLMSQDADWEKAVSHSEEAQKTLDSMSACGFVQSKKSATAFFPSKQEQQKRLQAWNELLHRKHELLTATLYEELSKEGFDPSAFSEYDRIISVQYPLLDWEEFRPLAEQVFRANLCQDSTSVTVVDILSVPNSKVEEVKQILHNSSPQSRCFDVNGMNQGISSALSDNFNYIGFACGIIVFFFLWLSFGRLELCLISFLPMVVGWIWILGIMQVFGIQFNIVNIILATFIFGQGDDYTIFMTDGLIYEHAYRRRLLASYKNSIVISALIMFIGIGSLIIARHPALHSLAEVTIVGMFSVVFMAYFLPPLLYGWLTKRHGAERRIPVTIERIVTTIYSTAVYVIQIVIGLLLGIILFPFGYKTDRARRIFHRYIRFMAHLDTQNIYGVNVRYRNPYREDFSKGAVIICNHQSIFDSLFMMGMSEKILIMTNSKVWNHPLVHFILQMADFLNTSDSVENNLEKLRDRLAAGYSVVIFPEGKRNSRNEVLRFHKGAFYYAEKLGADVLPVYLHGASEVMPLHSALSIRGDVTIVIGKRILASDDSYGTTYQERTKKIHKEFCRKYEVLKKQSETPHYYAYQVLQRYFYKGYSLEREVKRQLRRVPETLPVDAPEGKPIVVLNNGIGTMGLLLAYMYPQSPVYAFDEEADAVQVASGCLLPSNLHIDHADKMTADLLASSVVCIVNPSARQLEEYSGHELKIIKV